MANDVGRYRVNITGNSAGFRSAVGSAEKASSGFAKSLGRTAKLITGIGAGLIGFEAIRRGFTSLISTAEDFNQALTKSVAILPDIGGELRKKFEKAAVDVSRTTKFTSAQAAEAFYFLFSAGLNEEQSLGALPAVAQFAQAGAFDLALATDLATDAQSALGLTVADTAENYQNLVRVTDALIKANTLANASAQQFSEALTNKAGPALRGVGKPVEEGLAVLAAFADQGVKGAEAGTQFSIVLRDLQTKAIENAKAFRKANVEIFREGELRNLGDVISDLERALFGMSDQARKTKLLDLGFSDKSVAAIENLLGTSDKIRRYQEQLEKAAGITADVADKQITKLDRALALLRSEWESLSIETDGFNDTIAAVVESFATMVAGVTRFIEQTPGVRKFFDEFAYSEENIQKVTYQIGELIFALQKMGGEIEDSAIKLSKFFGTIAGALGLEDLARASSELKTISEQVELTGNRTFKLPKNFEEARKRFEEEVRERNKPIEPLISPKVNDKPIRDALDLVKQLQRAGNAPLLRGTVAEVTARFSEQHQFREQIRLLGEQLKEQREQKAELQGLREDMQAIEPIQLLEFGYFV